MRSFVTAIVVLILGIACLGIAAFRGMATRFPIAGIVPLAWSAIDLFFAFTQSSIDSQAEKVTDERDRYIAEKQRESPADHQLRNGAACFIAMFLFAVFKWEQLLTVTITLCAVLFLMLFVVIGRNSYYEKHE